MAMAKGDREFLKRPNPLGNFKQLRLLRDIQNVTNLV